MCFKSSSNPNFDTSKVRAKAEQWGNQVQQNMRDNVDRMQTGTAGRPSLLTSLKGTK